MQKGDVHVIIKISDQVRGQKPSDLDWSFDRPRVVACPNEFKKRCRKSHAFQAVAGKNPLVQAWQYGWTTADHQEDDHDDPYSGSTWRKELAGYGFGLPLTRRKLFASFDAGTFLVASMLEAPRPIFWRRCLYAGRKTLRYNLFKEARGLQNFCVWQEYARIIATPKCSAQNL